jgi:GT2 family glycosyltransferase
MNTPDVSVVMSVFNSAPTLAETLESVLKQDGVKLELIAVDDGSTDGSSQILLAHAAKDPRLVVIQQENRGLTASLIRGCMLAQGEFIARQDAGGDISLPNRLKRQLAYFSNNPGAVMVSCGTRFIGPGGETLYEVIQNGAELNRNFEEIDSSQIKGVSSHPSVMMRRGAYLAVGGYRPQFEVAQDLDLWLRLSEVGECLGLPEILYVTCISKGSITHLNREVQNKATQAILRCAEARRRGRDDAEILEGLRIRRTPAQGWLLERIRDARFYYFIGAVIRIRQPDRAYEYYMQALACWPLYPRAWLGLLRLVRSNFSRRR